MRTASNRAPSAPRAGTSRTDRSRSAVSATTSSAGTSPAARTASAATRRTAERRRDRLAAMDLRDQLARLGERDAGHARRERLGRDGLQGEHRRSTLASFAATRATVRSDRGVSRGHPRLCDLSGPRLRRPLAGPDALEQHRLGGRHRPGPAADRRARRRERDVPAGPEAVAARQGDRARQGGQPRLRPRAARGRRARRLPRRHRARRASATMPKLRDEVAVVGYPVGGEEISITEGVVSRIEVQRYSHSQRHLLAVTVDAAINAGNSGGPVFGDGKVVGIAFQKLTGVDNIGEMVPPPIIRAFLDGVDEGQAARDPGARHHDAEPREPAAAQAARARRRRARRRRAARRSRRLRRRRARAARRDHHDRRPADREQRHRPVHGPLPHALRRRARPSLHRRQDQARRSSATARPRPSRSSSSSGCRSCRARATTSRRSTSSTAGSCSRPLTRDYLTTWDKWWNKAPEGVPQLLLPGLPHAPSSTRS